VTHLEADWASIRAQYVNPLLKYGKPIMFTEVGYRNITSDHLNPWVYSASSTHDSAEQVRDYTALLAYWRGFAWWGGVTWWNWDVSPVDGSTNNDYTVQHKPAEATMRAYFAHNG
jgi:hypothetical protein